MLSLPRTLLARLGQFAAPAYAISIVLGLALPQLAAAMRPVLPVTIFIFTMLAFARMNMPGMGAVLAAPRRLLGTFAVSCVLPPLVGYLFLHVPFFRDLEPGIKLGIALMAAAPPLMASPVYAALLGFENSLALATLVLGMVATPFLAPMTASLMAGAEVPIAPSALAERLLLFVGSGIFGGFALRWLVGMPRLQSIKLELDGLGVLMFFLFAIAAMDGVLVASLAMPAQIFTMLALSTGISALNFALAYLILRPLAFNDRFSASICIGLRNMGLLVAPIIAILPKMTFLYFALAQIPIYVAPLMLKALKAWLEKRNRSA
ncbi:COG0385 Predicted Na+-dependent transporter [Rhabdaerophilaceae bacterium]